MEITECKYHITYVHGTVVMSQRLVCGNVGSTTPDLVLPAWQHQCSSGVYSDAHTRARAEKQQRQARLPAEG